MVRDSSGEERTTARVIGGNSSAESLAVRPPGPFVVVVGVLVALWCVGFAAISVWLEATQFFATGEYADDAAALSVMNWLVTVIKLVGAAVALLAIRRRPMAPRLVGTMLWAAFATLSVYVAGSVVQAVVIVAGVAGDREDFDMRSVAYVAAFLFAAAGFGILAISFARRTRLGRRVALVGALGAPLVLGTVLVLAPAILSATGLLSID